MRESSTLATLDCLVFASFHFTPNIPFLETPLHTNTLMLNEARYIYLCAYISDQLINYCDTRIPAHTHYLTTLLHEASYLALWLSP